MKIAGLAAMASLLGLIAIASGMLYEEKKNDADALIAIALLIGALLCAFIAGEVAGG